MLLFVPALLILALVSCGTRPTARVGEPTEIIASPAATVRSRVSTPPSYDTEIYGDLENLSPDNQIVTYWHHHTGPHEELLSAMVDEFNRSNEWDITVLAESQESCDDLYQKLLTGIPSRQLPSVATACQGQLATYAAQGAPVVLSPYVESEMWGYTREEVADFFPAALSTGYLPQFKARYGWPFYKSTEVMVYNEDWLAELGFDGPPETWDAFASMACSAIEQPFSGATGEGVALGYEYSIDALRFPAFVYSRGGDIINEDATAYVFNGPEGLASLAFLKDLGDRGCAAPTVERDRDRTDFSAGWVLFTISPVHHLPHYGEAISERAGFQWSVNPPPHSADRDASRMDIYGPVHLIFRTTPGEQLAAWLFVRWMSEPEQQARWAAGTSYYPVRQSTVDLLTEYFAEHPIYEKAFGFLSYDYGLEPPAAGYAECRAVIAEMIGAVIAGEDAQAQLDAAVERCNQSLRGTVP